MTFILFTIFLALTILAFIPAIIAACKDLHFTKWYIYSFFLFPIALVHSLVIKKSQFVHTIGVFTEDKKNPSGRAKKVYKALSFGEQSREVSPVYICVVFLSKMIFSAFVALAFFALFRVLNSDIAFLRTVCTNFAIAFAIMLSIVQICGFSRVPVIADEITKRAIVMLFFSILCSLPFYLIKKFLLAPFEKYSDFLTFLCAALSMISFVLILLSRQRIYYSAFSRFTDYCTLSLLSYSIYAAISLILLSMDFVRPYVNMVAMPMQVLSLDNLGEIADALPDLSYIYSSALAHFAVALIILLSGLLCRDYKRKELEARVEYRTNAFRMSRKRILRRHISNMDAAKINPLK